MTTEQVKTTIREAFASTERPGNWALRGSSEGEEPYLVEKAFAEVSDWRTADPSFLDQAPEGFGSALSFFSDEAFRYFLPAYLLADLDGRLQTADPAFHLWHGLDDDTRQKPVNPRRYGSRTWFDEMRHKFSVFSRPEARAILAYLRHRAEADAFARPRIEQAIRSYWMSQAIVHVALVVRDYHEAIAFYVGKLGFRLVEDTEQPEQQKRWVVVAPPGDGGASLLLARARTPEQAAAVGNQTGGRVFLFLKTDDFTRDYDRFRAAGVSFVRPPTEQPYGTVAVFEDLYGNRWDLVEYRG